MQVKWRYFYENIGTNKCVAVMTNEADDTCILTVYEEKKLFMAIPTRDYSFLYPFYIHQVESWYYVDNNFGQSLSKKEVSEKCVEYACTRFEIEFRSRMEKHLSLLA